MSDSAKEMPTGREMDALIAEKVMGGKWLRFHDADYQDPDSGDGRVHALIVLPKDFSLLSPPDYVEDTGECPRDRYGWIPRYSVDITAAWTVVTKLVEQGYEVITRVAPNEKPRVRLDSGGTEGRVVTTHGETLPLAICQAALSMEEMGGNPT